MRRAFITGITGQDGSYLAEWLLRQEYEVHGLVRPTTQPARSRLAHLCQDPAIYQKRLFFHSAELADAAALRQVLAAAQPSEIYHLAGQTHVGLSFEKPALTCELTALATVRLLEMARELRPEPKFFHASSSEIFGHPLQVPQDEQTPLVPVSPYGCAKAFATQIVTVFRKSYGLFASNGILFNHESPRRDERFVTKKICAAAAAIRLGRQKELLLGDLKAQRDWGHARDYVQGIWLSLQQEQPEDFVFATGQLHSVRDVLDHAFGSVQLDWTQYVRSDPQFTRPAEPQRLVGNPAKAKQLLGWEPRTGFDELIVEMTQAELAALQGSGG
jgi:GDPmannose 4,6-dehydratase